MTSSPSDEARRTFVVAVTDGARFCLDVARVREVVPIERVTWVPGADPAVLGVINVRGRVLALVSLSAALRGEEGGGADGDESPAGSAIVLDLGTEAEIAVAVQEVLDVVELPDDALQPPPAFGLGGAAPFTEAVVSLEDGLAVILDVDGLFGHGEASRLTGIGAGDGA